MLDAPLPALTLGSTIGPVELRALGADLLVLFVFPHASGPAGPPMPDWDAIPGARGCTPQACGFRDEHGRLRDLGAAVAGLSVQTVDEQRELAERAGLQYPLLSDPDRLLVSVLGLPVFHAGTRTFYQRLALVVRSRRVVKVFHPVLEPEHNARDVAGWLEHAAGRRWALS